jgi:RimJ/RimL family protein N-acetyltransferase
MCREHATSGDLDLGYRLRSSAWNRGYATEGARALIRKCLTDLGARRVLANTYQDNHASRRVMEKAGMRLIRTFRYTPEDILAGRTNHVTTGDLWDGDDVEYAILRTDWERLEAAATSGTGT